MKKVALLLLTSVLIVSCGTTRKIPRVKDKIDTVKMGKYDPVELGSGTMRLKRLVSSELEAKEFSVMLYPRDGTAGILYRKMPNKERLLLDKDARDAVIKSYQEYLKDFEGKKLDRSKKKFEPAYEYARAKVEWGPVQYSSYADPRIVMGYVFVGKSPYFCIKVPNTESDQNKGDTPISYGGNILYFTRSQGQDLVNALSDEEIREALNSFIIELPADDEYGSSDENNENGDYDETDDAEPVSKKDKKAKKASSKSKKQILQETTDQEAPPEEYSEN